MIAALRKSAERLAEIVLVPVDTEPVAETSTNPLEFNPSSVPEEFIEMLMSHYMRPFDGSYVKAFEFPVVVGANIKGLIVAAREAGYHVTRPEDGVSIFAMSIDEVETLLCQVEPDQHEIPETDWN